MNKSRFEKFQSYRDQIQNRDELTKIFVTEDSAVTAYKKELNALSKNILLDSQAIHLDFLPFTSVDKAKKKEINEIRNFINSFDFVLLNKIRDTTNHIICQSSDNINEEFEKDWVANDRGWIFLQENCALAQTCRDAFARFKITIPESIKKLNEIINKTKSANENELFQKTPINFNQTKIRTKRWKFYFVVLAIVGATAVTLLVLSIVVFALLNKL